ncbi:MAG: hypothetical protein CMM60_14310 [Rhodospirillaceae bacterium]|nr:hypothetical protein [Rhodospirillaceae bacterium]
MAPWVSAYALDGFANAAEALTGEAVKATSLWAMIFSAGFTVFYLALGFFYPRLERRVDEAA